LLKPGELGSPVKERRVVAVIAPGGCVLGELAGQYQTGLFVFQPAAQPRPSFKESVMGYLGSIVT
jgi:hypothetical protein